MAATKPEVLISQLPGKVETKFQMLHPHCQVQLLSKVVMSTVESNRKSEFKYGRRQTGSTYISRSTTDRHPVPTVILRFSGSPDSTDSSPPPPTLTDTGNAKWRLLDRK